jgi:hypothetical protein
MSFAGWWKARKLRRLYRRFKRSKPRDMNILRAFMAEAVRVANESGR